MSGFRTICTLCVTLINSEMSASQNKHDADDNGNDNDDGDDDDDNNNNNINNNNNLQVFLDPNSSFLITNTWY